RGAVGDRGRVAGPARRRVLRGVAVDLEVGRVVALGQPTVVDQVLTAGGVHFGEVHLDDGGPDYRVVPAVDHVFEGLFVEVLLLDKRQDVEEQTSAAVERGGGVRVRVRPGRRRQLAVEGVGGVDGGKADLFEVVLVLAALGIPAGPLDR